MNFTFDSKISISFLGRLIVGVLISLFPASRAEAQTSLKSADLSTDEAVIAELKKMQDAKNAELAKENEALKKKLQAADKINKENVCIERLKESPKIIAVAFFRNDYGCHFEGAFVGSRYYDAAEIFDAAKPALDALGWENANRKTRERLARIWSEKVLNAFSNLLYAIPKDFGKSGFHPPQATSTEKGEITVSLWIQLPQGRTREKGFQHLEYIFDENGNMTSGRTTENLLVHQ